MATITLGGIEIHTQGDLPAVGSIAPGFTLTKSDFSKGSLSDYKGQKVILNIFPSLDTGICATSIRTFNKEAANLENTTVLCISKDLPTSHYKFCTTEGIENVVPLSDFRDGNFAAAYQNRISDGKFAGLLSRVVIVIDEEGYIKYTEQVPEIGQEPNYKAALAAL